MSVDPVLLRLEARFHKRLRTLLRNDAGRWALVVDGTRQGEIQTFGTEQEALVAGASHPSRKRFCVRHVSEADDMTYAALGPRETGAVFPN